MAVVTGVGSGVGSAIAREFADDGAQVVGCDIDAATGQAVMDQIGGTFRRVDVSNQGQVKGLVEWTVSAFGPLDVMVNNAAVQIAGSLLSTSEDDLDATLAVNLKGPFFGTQAAVEAMLNTGGGSIINISSVLGLVGDGELAAYCTAKAGLLGLTRATAVRYGRDGIRCNAVCPGDIETPLVEAYFRLSSDPVGERLRVTSQYPLARIALPADVAKLVCFLASDDSAYITGQVHVIDGGLLANAY